MKVVFMPPVIQKAGTNQWGDPAPASKKTMHLGHLAGFAPQRLINSQSNNSTGKPRWRRAGKQTADRGLAYSRTQACGILGRRQRLGIAYRKSQVASTCGIYLEMGVPLVVPLSCGNNTTQAADLALVAFCKPAVFFFLRLMVLLSQIHEQPFFELFLRK